MKIRMGFVSNSSSSSFIIQVFDSKPCKHCGRSDSSFLKMVEGNFEYDDSDSVECTGKEEILERLKEGWCLSSEALKEIKAKMDAAMKKDAGEVYMITLSNHGRLYESLTEFTAPNVKIIQNLGDG
jgi:hypothetical protein